MNVLTEPFFALWNAPRDFKAGFVSAILLMAFVGLVVFALFGGVVHAELHSEVETTFSTLQDDFNSLLDLAWPFIGAVLSGMWIIGMFIRLVYKAG